MKPQISAAIVLYKTHEDDLTKVLSSLLNSSVSTIYLIDNSPSDALKTWKNSSKKIEYIFTGKNLGFGTGHNIAINKSIEQGFKYHLVVNPDIYFEKGTVENIIDYMEMDITIGMIMPKILANDGKIKYNRSLLPTPLNIYGKLLPASSWYRNIEFKYRTRFYSYDKPMPCAYLSGCFYAFRITELQKNGGFDERFFMYFEDTDISRRFYKNSVSLYYPYAEVYHIGNNESHRNIKMFFALIKSSIQYFNKYGYFFDKERRQINKFIQDNYYY